VRGTNNRNLPSHGRYWIDIETGGVLRSELQLEDVYALTRLSTIFRWDDRFGINAGADEQLRAWRRRQLGRHTRDRHGDTATSAASASRQRKRSIFHDEGAGRTTGPQQGHQLVR
jgi:hypothetical protein